MKTLFLAILTFVSVSLLNAQYCGFSGPSVCTPAGGAPDSLIFPSSLNFPPLINGYQSNAVVHLPGYDYWTFSGQSLTIQSVRFDTISNLPAGLCWSTSSSNNTFLNKQPGCIAFNGTACAPPGQYKLNIVATINVGVPIQTNLEAAGAPFYLRVKNAADPTIPVDTTQFNPFMAYGNTGDCSPVLAVDLGADQTVCAGSSLTLSSSALGGVEPYTYSWAASSGILSCNNCAHPQVTVSQNSTYSVTVIDATGASATDVVTYATSATTNTIQFASVTNTDISCATPVDLTTVTISGVNAPLVFTWGDGSMDSVGQLTITHNYQQAGTYIISVRDDNGCVASQVHQVDFNGILITGQVTQPNCIGMATGGIQVTPSNGTAPYTYAWSNGATTASITGISAGHYYVTVTDATACSFSEHFSVAPLSNWAYYSFLQASGSNCNNNGYVLNSVYGGTPPYTYVWSNGDTSQSLTGISGGSYTVTITDSIGCVVEGNAVVATNCYSVVTGNVFTDLNNNCAPDAGEYPPAYMYIMASSTADSSTYYGTVNSSGNYSVLIPASGTFTLSANAYSVYGCTGINFCGAGTSTVTIPNIGDTISNVNFGVTTNGAYDLYVQATWSAGNPGFNKVYNIYYGNNSATAFTGNGTVTFNYDPVLIYQSSIPTATHNLANHTLTWNVNQLSMDSGSFGSMVQGTFLVPIGTSLSTLLASSFNIAPTSNDCYLSNNTITNTQQVTGSYDPNEKKVSPEGDIVENDSVLTYTIGFQNTGTDSTHFIILKDTLSPYLDPTTIRNLASSHPYTEFSISGAGILTWTFNPLRLVDSFTNEPESHGFVIFSIKKKPNLPVGTVINNTAHIYFDYNDAVVTNTVTNKLSEPNGITTLHMPGGLTVTAFPNPFTHSTNIAIEGLEGKYDFELYDLNGRLRKRLTGMDASQFILQRDELSAGMYFFKVLSPTNSKGGYGKLMIE